jgi:TPR repeat protein
MFQRGTHVSQDYARAAELFERGCEGSDALGCSSLALLLRDRLAGEYDEARILELVERACEYDVDMCPRVRAAFGL